MTTIESVELELIKSGIKTNGCNTNLSKLIYNVIISALHFGEEKINESRLGVVTKQIALDVYRKDNRKPVICDITFKTVLR